MSRTAESKDNSKKRKGFKFSGAGTSDGKGGLILPDGAIEALKDENGTLDAIWVDGIPYPYIRYEGKKHPIVQTDQGWTIGGEVAVAQHKKNVMKEAATKEITIQILEPPTSMIQ